MGLGSFEFDIDANVRGATRGLDDVASGADDASVATGDAGDAFVDMGESSDDASSAMDDMSQGAGDATDGLDGLGNVAAGAVAAVGGLMVASSVADALSDAAEAAREMVTGVADAGDEAAKAASRMGITAEAVQELRFAGELADISLRQFEGSFRRLSAQVDDARQGMGTAVDSFDRLGISMQDIEGLGIDETFDLVIDGLRDISDEGERSAMAQEFFGRSGTRLMTILDDESASLAEMRQEARDLGIVMTNESAAAAEGFNDSLVRLEARQDAARQAMASVIIESQALDGVFGALDESLNGLNETLLENEEAIQALADDSLFLLQGAIESLGDDANMLAGIIDSVGGAMGAAEEESSGLLTSVDLLAGGIQLTGRALPQFAIATELASSKLRDFTGRARDAREEAEDLTRSWNEATAVGQRFAMMMEHNEDVAALALDPLQDIREALKGISEEAPDEEISIDVPEIHRPERETIDLSADRERLEIIDRSLDLQEEQMALAQNRLAILTEEDSLEQMKLQKKQAELQFEMELERIRQEGLEGLERDIALQQARNNLIAEREKIDTRIARLNEDSADAVAEISKQEEGIDFSQALAGATSLTGEMTNAAGASADTKREVDELSRSIGGAVNLATQLGAAFGGIGLGIGAGVGAVSGLRRLFGSGGRDEAPQQVEEAPQFPTADEIAEALVEAQQASERPIVVNMNLRDAPRNEAARLVMDLVEMEPEGVS